MQTYLFGDVTVLINIIQIKGPVELLGDWPPEQHRQSYDEVLEADWSVSVYVKCVEQEVSIRGCICGQNDMFNPPPKKTSPTVTVVCLADNNIFSVPTTKKAKADVFILLFEQW